MTKAKVEPRIGGSSPWGRIDNLNVLAPGIGQRQYIKGQTSLAAREKERLTLLGTLGESIMITVAERPQLIGLPLQPASSAPPSERIGTQKDYIGDECCWDERPLESE